MEKFAEYRDGQTKMAIYRYGNGKFYNHYDAENPGGVIAGGYATLEEAEHYLTLHRPHARKISQDQPKNLLDIYDLWSAACAGENDVLQAYYENGGEINRRYIMFGKTHSLIAGAYRNGNIDTVSLLQRYGETPEDHEREELKNLYFRLVMKAAENLVDYMRYHNKNLTKKQENLIDALAETMQI